MSNDNFDYKADIPEFAHFWNPLKTRVAAYYLLRRYEAILTAFRCLANDGLNLTTARVASLGCAEGKELRFLCELGANPGTLIGIDLDRGALAISKYRNPEIHVVQANATNIHLPSNSFDVVSQATLFSSILGQKERRQVAREMQRLTKPGGAIIWFDLYRVSPPDDTLHPIDYMELKQLFSGWQMQLWPVYVRMDWLNKLLYIAPRLCPLLESMYFTCQCYNGILRRR